MGAYGKANWVWQHLNRAKDSAQALGSAYAFLLATVAPFLGDDDILLFAASHLLTLLPYLSDDLAGGLWRHHLGRLAYYQGEFAEALQQFGMEWKLHQQDLALKARLQRSIASELPWRYAKVMGRR